MSSNRVLSRGIWSDPTVTSGWRLQGALTVRRQLSYNNIAPLSSLARTRPGGVPVQPQRRLITSTRAASYPANQEMPGSDEGKPAAARPGKKPRQQLAEPRPSASIILLSPANQVLLLHRVQNSSSFASAHVFPGGNLDVRQDGEVPAPGTPGRHRDGPAYRFAAIRETFEEAGIVLARRREKDGGAGASRDGPTPLLNIPDAERERARHEIHGNRTGFREWVELVGGEADVENLIPFTRWITPVGMPRRFTTQMYIYMLPLGPSTADAAAPGAPRQETLVPVPTTDGGLEHTSARFDDASTWLARARTGEIILFPPQHYLLHLIAQFCTGRQAGEKLSVHNDAAQTRQHYQTQRDALRSFLERTPASAVNHPTSAIPWADKVMCPVPLQSSIGDGRRTMALDKPGPEIEALRAQGKEKEERGGDFERVVLARFSPAGPTEVEIRSREEVLREQREEAARGTSSKL